MSENNEEVVVDTTNNEGEESESISISKTEWDKTNQTLGSLKRELKDLRKAKEDTKETPTSNKPDENALSQKLERMALRQAGITHPDDVELARKTAEKWKVDVDEVLSDEDFKIKLERQQTGRANIDATSNIKAGSGTSQAKNTPEYWVAKGVPPSATDVPDRKLRAKIARAMIGATKDNSKYYNE